MTQKKQEIQKLEDLELVRLRPGVYIPNINYFVYELADNSTDEYKEGFGKHIYIKIDQNREITVKDKGRGLPTEPSADFPEKSQAEVAFSSIGAGSKFTTEGAKSLGLNGIGSAGINFLSEYFDVTIKRNSKVYHMRFEKGVCVEQLHETGKTIAKNTGTEIVCRPDDEIWKDKDDLDIPTIKRRVKQICYLNPGLTIDFEVDYKEHKIRETYLFEDGLNSYIKDLLGDEEPLTTIYRIEKSVAINENGETIDLDIAFAYTEKYSDNIIAFTNNVLNTNKRSSNITGFKAGISNAIKELIDDEELNKNNKLDITSEDTREGIIAIVSNNLFNPFYEGQGKDILNMPIVRQTVSNAVEEFILERFDKNPNEKNIILNKVLEAARVREAAKRTRDAARKTKTLGSGKVPGLKDANNKDPEVRVLWLVEGDSAGGSAKEAGNPETDAILPVFGKINNTYNMSLEQVLKSPKLLTAIKAFGCNIGEDFDIEKLNYKHIVIMTDADVDGLHIRCLWITFFYRFLRPIIEAGYLYIAQPPLYTIRCNPYTKKQKNIYAYDEKERDEILATLDCKYEITRNKGLGEQSPAELKESTMAEETRRLLRVTVEDAEECMRILDICMNDKSIKQRKEFILNRGVI